MKRFIFAAIDIDIDYNLDWFEGTPFKCDTGTTWGNEFLNKKELEYKQSAKNRTGQIMRMSPSEYFKDCSMYGFDKHVPVYQLETSRRDKLVEQYIEDMKAGDKFPLCYINYADRSQEGLHRMMAAGDVFGWNTKFPVLVITAYDPEREAQIKFLREVAAFQEERFPHICGYVGHHLSDWKSPPPEDFTEQYREGIIKEAADYFKIIDVDVEIKDIEGHPRVYVYLTSYKDRFGDRTWNAEVLSDPYKIWLDELFDIEGVYADRPEFTITEDDIDDIDIADLFFRDDSEE